MPDENGVGYLVDPDIDMAVFGATTRHDVNVIAVAGTDPPGSTRGWQLKCACCGLEGLRIYMGKGQATHYQFVVNERLALPSAPKCEQNASEAA